MKPTSFLASFAIVAGLALGTTGCSSTLAQPFQSMKSQPITIYRLQNYEPPQGGAASGMAAALPPQIQQWLTAGAQMLPPGLLPAGLLPGGTPAATGDAPRFHNFRILGSVTVTDPKQRDEILSLVGKESNFTVPREQCMFAEFGIQIGQGAPPGMTVGMTAGGQPPADILISLSCGTAQMVNYGWPYGAKTGLAPDTSDKVMAIARKAFGG